MSLRACAQRSYAWETGDTRPYLRPGNWNDVYQGLLAGEGLLLSLQQLENAYLAWDQRCLEVRKTISLENLSRQTLSATIRDLLEPVGQGGEMTESAPVEVKLEDGQLEIRFDLEDIAILDDYPAVLSLGDLRLIKSMSVSLPALLGPYQDIQALLHYASPWPLAPGCTAIAVSHGLNDSGQFQLNFNDGKYLPFEGVSVDKGAFSLVFPNADTTQKELLLSLTDIILHVNYTIRSPGSHSS